MGKRDTYREALKILECLKKEHSTYTLGQHFSTAMADYGDVWGMSDKEFLFALEKYRAELEFVVPEPIDELEKIIREGSNLDTLFNDEEEEEE